MKTRITFKSKHYSLNIDLRMKGTKVPLDKHVSSFGSGTLLKIIPG